MAQPLTSAEQFQDYVVNVGGYRYGFLQVDNGVERHSILEIGPWNRQLIPSRRRLQ